MDKKTTGWVAYCTFIGWIIAFCAGDKEGAKYHLNQALVIWLGFICISVATMILAFIPILGWLVAIAGWLANIFLFVCCIIGLIAAINEEEKELPLIGQIKILK